LAKEIRAESGRIEQEARTLFDTFWARVMDSDDIANTSKLAVAIKAVRLPESDKRCFASKSQRSDIEACFLELSDTRQEALAHGGTN
jgi:hypothetical protein